MQDIHKHWELSLDQRPKTVLQRWHDVLQSIETYRLEITPNCGFTVKDLSVFCDEFTDDNLRWRNLHFYTTNYSWTFYSDINKPISYHIFIYCTFDLHLLTDTTSLIIQLLKLIHEIKSVQKLILLYYSHSLNQVWTKCIYITITSISDHVFYH